MVPKLSNKELTERLTEMERVQRANDSIRTEYSLEFARLKQLVDEQQKDKQEYHERLRVLNEEKDKQAQLHIKLRESYKRATQKVAEQHETIKEKDSVLDSMEEELDFRDKQIDQLSKSNESLKDDAARYDVGSKEIISERDTLAREKNRLLHEKEELAKKLSTTTDALEQLNSKTSESQQYQQRLQDMEAVVQNFLGREDGESELKDLDVADIVRRLAEKAQILELRRQGSPDSMRAQLHQPKSGKRHVSLKDEMGESDSEMGESGSESEESDSNSEEDVVYSDDEKNAYSDDDDDFSKLAALVEARHTYAPDQGREDTIIADQEESTPASLQSGPADSKDGGQAGLAHEQQQPGSLAIEEVAINHSPVDQSARQNVETTRASYLPFVDLDGGNNTTTANSDAATAGIPQHGSGEEPVDDFWLCDPDMMDLLKYIPLPENFDAAPQTQAGWTQNQPIQGSLYTAQNDAMLIHVDGAQNVPIQAPIYTTQNDAMLNGTQYTVPQSLFTFSHAQNDAMLNGTQNAAPQSLFTFPHAQNDAMLNGTQSAPPQSLFTLLDGGMQEPFDGIQNQAPQAPSHSFQNESMQMSTDGGENEAQEAGLDNTENMWDQIKGYAEQDGGTQTDISSFERSSMDMRYWTCVDIEPRAEPLGFSGMYSVETEPRAEAPRVESTGFSSIKPIDTEPRAEPLRAESKDFSSIVSVGFEPRAGPRNFSQICSVGTEPRAEPPGPELKTFSKIKSIVIAPRRSRPSEAEMRARFIRNRRARMTDEEKQKEKDEHSAYIASLVDSVPPMPDTPPAPKPIIQIVKVPVEVQVPKFIREYIFVPCQHTTTDLLGMLPAWLWALLVFFFMVFLLSYGMEQSKWLSGNEFTRQAVLRARDEAKFFTMSGLSASGKKSLMSMGGVFGVDYGLMG